MAGLVFLIVLKFVKPFYKREKYHFFDFFLVPRDLRPYAL